MQMLVGLSVGLSVSVTFLCHNSVNFDARTSRFCMEVDLYNTYNMILMKMMMMIMTMMMIIMMKMMKMIIAPTQSIFKLGPPDLE